MAEHKLKFGDGELVLKEGVTTLGRTSENNVAFPSDSNVSRYHAEIEKRGSEFCLIDLNSSNGTTVNGSKVSGETYLKPSDRIMLGGSSEIVFETTEPEAEKPEPDDMSPVNMPPVGAAVQQLPSLAAASPATGSRTMLMVAGGAVLVAVVVVAVTGAVYYRSYASSCDAKAKIIKPEPGDTIFEPTEVEIEIDADDSGCVARAIFTVDGVEFAKTADSPYIATLDPKDHPELADGFDHDLGVILEDENGKQLPQGEGILLALETRKVEKPEDKPIPGKTEDLPQQPAEPKVKEVALIDVQKMTNRLVEQFSGSKKYNVSNKQFLQEVQKRAAEYAQEGYFERAAPYKDLINTAFITERNLAAPLGHVLAMSRSKFTAQKQAADEGLWRMNPEFVKANAYDLCAGQPISEPTQKCAAKAAALYMKEMVYGVFDGDAIYAAVAFGKSTADATTWKSTLPADRSDVWNSIKTAPEREQLVRFFAAGIVAENPSKFGLKKDRPLSDLYRQAM